MNTVTQLTEGIQGSGPAQRAQVLGPPTPAGRGKGRDTTGGQDWVLWNRKFKKKNNISCKICFIFKLCICWGSMRTCQCRLLQCQEENTRFPSTDAWKVPDLGAYNWSQFLWKSSVYSSPLSHRSTKKKFIFFVCNLVWMEERSREEGKRKRKREELGEKSGRRREMCKEREGIREDKWRDKVCFDTRVSCLPPVSLWEHCIACMDGRSELALHWF